MRQLARRLRCVPRCRSDTCLVGLTGQPTTDKRRWLAAAGGTHLEIAATPARSRTRHNGPPSPPRGPCPTRRHTGQPVCVSRQPEARHRQLRRLVQLPHALWPAGRYSDRALTDNSPHTDNSTTEMIPPVHSTYMSSLYSPEAPPAPPAGRSDPQSAQPIAAAHVLCSCLPSQLPTQPVMVRKPLIF